MGRILGEIAFLASQLESIRLLDETTLACYTIHWCWASEERFDPDLQIVGDILVTHQNSAENEWR
jgi:hypothetical protein